MTMPTDVRPFSNGTEGTDWMSANCHRCVKNGPYDAQGKGPCAMETAVARGFILGTVPAELAIEYGATKPREHADRGYIDMPRECVQFVPLGVCEWIKWPGTRRRIKCGKPTSETIVHQGHTMSACARHRRAYLKAIAAEAVA